MPFQKRATSHRAIMDVLRSRDTIILRKLLISLATQGGTDKPMAHKGLWAEPRYK